MCIRDSLGQIILQEAFRGKNALGNKVINYAVVVYDYDKDTFLDEKATTSTVVSYTHLDVYKRQGLCRSSQTADRWPPGNLHCSW